MKIMSDIKGRSLSSLESEKLIDNIRVIHPIHDAYPQSCTLRSEKKMLSITPIQKTQPQAIKISKRPEKIKKLESLEHLNRESPLVRSTKSIKMSKHLPSLSIGDRLINESCGKYTDRAKNMQSIVSMEDEYLILGRNYERFGKKKIVVGNNKNRKVYKESNRNSCLMIKKLREDYS